MKKTTVGFAMTGSYCTFEKNLAQMEELVRRGYEVLPILSYNAGELDTRFMTAEHLRERLVSITGHEPIDTLQAAGPVPDFACHRQHAGKAGEWNLRYAGAAGGQEPPAQ